MKSSGVIWTLCAAAVLQAVVNIYVRQAMPPSAALDRASESNDSNPIKAARPDPLVQTTSTNADTAAAPLPFAWSPVESSDYKQYIKNLESLGFPEPLIREIVLADIDKLYAQREDEVKIKPVPPDAPASQRRRKPVPEDIERMKKHRDLLIEKQQILENLLDTRVPREMIRTPNSRNWEAYEYAITLLPPEKQDAVKYIQETLWIQDDANQTGNSDYLSRDKTELETYTRAAEERDAALKQVLTPEEFQRYERITTPTGSELARKTVGMEPTDDEMIAMFKVTDEYWKRTGAVHGRWRANPVPRDQIAAADNQLVEDLKQALGPERYIDYQMATTDMGQQMNNLRNRYNLPPETVRKTFSLLGELDQLNRLPRETSAADPRRVELESALQEALTRPIWEDWTRGRNQRYELQP